MLFFIAVTFTALTIFIPPYHYSPFLSTVHSQFFSSLLSPFLFDFPFPPLQRFSFIRSLFPPSFSPLPFAYVQLTQEYIGELCRRWQRRRGREGERVRIFLFLPPSSFLSHGHLSRDWLNYCRQQSHSRQLAFPRPPHAHSTAGG